MYRSYKLGAALSHGSQAGALFDGPAYRGLDCMTLSSDEAQRCQERVRFLSGLYGFLRPCDVIQDHRLEMGTKNLPLPEGMRTLYDFWMEDLSSALTYHFDERPGVLVNVASEEYFKAVPIHCLDKKKIKIVTCVFKDKGRVVSVYAKRARGLMARFVSTDETVHDAIRSNDVAGMIEALKKFDLENYFFVLESVNTKTSEISLTFDRKSPPGKGNGEEPKSQKRGIKRKAYE